MPISIACQRLNSMMRRPVNSFHGTFEIWELIPGSTSRGSSYRFPSCSLNIWSPLTATPIITLFLHSVVVVDTFGRDLSKNSKVSMIARRSVLLSAQNQLSREVSS